jgi:DNA-binding GntR family transcriptional regulator
VPARTIREKPEAPRKRAAYDALLDLMLSGELAPGQIINRRAIAARLRMSVAPVLEAMTRLEGEGFLEAIAHTGTRVRSASPQDIAGNLVVREALECEAARVYCGERLRRALPSLMHLARELDRMTTDTRACWDAEVALHQALVDLAGFPALSRIFRPVMRTSLFFQLNSVVPPFARRRGSHGALLRRLAKDDPGGAEGAIRAHLRWGRDGLIARGGIK